MTRHFLLVLLLATGVALADEAPGAKPEGGTSETQAHKKDAAKSDAGTAAQTKEQAESDTTAEAKAAAKDGSKTKGDPNLGMSILGNQEAPKALVIVPWKRSEIGNALGISPMFDDSRLPIDKEVFMRALSYYEIRSGGK
jgi:hypothetical protein